MPINAGAVGIQPVAPQRQTGAPESIQRRDGGASSGFQMQTNVALKTAIEDLAATLSKISSQEKYGVDKLPTDIGQLVRNILRQSLSMNETLMQGIGSTIESQRFSTDQLSILARMLSQIGALAEKGFSMELSDETKTLLTQFKNLIVSENGGSALEPVLMTKSAFELVDSKNAEDLPRALYEILAQLSQSPSMPITQPNQSEGMQFLKQLVQYFMPRPSAEESSNRGQMQQPAQMQQQTRRPTATQQLLNSMYRQFDDPYAQLDKQQLQSRQTPDLQSFSRTPDTQNQGQPQQSQQVASKSDGFSPVQVANSQNSPVQNQPQPQQMASNQQSQQAAPKSDTFSPVQGANSQNQPIQNQQQSPQMASNQQSQQAAPKSDTFSPVQVENNQNSPVQNQPQSPQMASNQQSQQAAPKSDAFSPVQGANSQNSPVQNQSQSPQMASNQQSHQAAPKSDTFSPVQGANSQNSPVQNQSQTQQMASNQQSQQAAPKSDTFSPVQGANSQNSPVQNQSQQPQMASNQQSRQAAPKSDAFSPVQGANSQNSPVQNQSQQPQMASNQQSQQAAPKSDTFSPVQGANSQNQPVQNQSQTQQMASNQQSQQVAQNSNDFSRVGVENSQKPQTAPNQQTHSKTVEDGGFSIERERKTQQPFDEDFLSKQQELKEQMLFAKTLMLRQPIQNTPQTMDALKNLAQFLMRSPSSESMTPRESTMLQNFVNNSQTMFSREEARHLQNLLRLCQQNVPTVVQQAAVQQKLPDLPRLWAFMQLCDMAGVNSNMTARAFKKAGREVSDFANTIRQAMGGDNSSVQNQRSFQMMLPLYMGENETSYPTYLSVYDENTTDKETGIEKKETWLRICVLTDNIGAAELIFRVYEKNQLDMRFYFSQGEVAEDFKDYISNLRLAVREQTNFQIGEIRLGSIGERMMLAQ